MTDRVRTLTVLLDRDMRDDDVQCVIDAIKMIRRVAVVTPNVTTSSDHTARMIARAELRVKLFEAIDKITQQT